MLCPLVPLAETGTRYGIVGKSYQPIYYAVEHGSLGHLSTLLKGVLSCLAWTLHCWFCQNLP